MKQEINLNQFRDAFTNMGRKDQFSYEGQAALFAYLEDEAGDHMLDVIALCCEFTEATLEEVIANYPDITSFDELADRTLVLQFLNNKVIYQNF